DFVNQSYLLLTNPSLESARDMAQALADKAAQKQQRIREIVTEVERRLVRTPSQEVIFQGDPAWRLVLAGSAASILCNKYGKPAFIFKRMDGESAGSVRSPKGTNSVQAMATCKDFLVTYGGHPQASGFRVKNEDLGRFEASLNEYFAK